MKQTSIFYQQQKQFKNAWQMCSCQLFKYQWYGERNFSSPNTLLERWAARGQEKKTAMDCVCFSKTRKMEPKYSTFSPISTILAFFRRE